MQKFEIPSLGPLQQRYCLFRKKVNNGSYAPLHIYDFGVLITPTTHMSGEVPPCATLVRTTLYREAQKHLVALALLTLLLITHSIRIYCINNIFLGSSINSLTVLKKMTASLPSNIL